MEEAGNMQENTTYPTKEESIDNINTIEEIKPHS